MGSLSYTSAKALISKALRRHIFWQGGTIQPTRITIIRCNCFPLYFFFFFGLRHVACGISVPWPGIEPGPPTRPPGNSLKYSSEKRSSAFRLPRGQDTKGGETCSQPRPSLLRGTRDTPVCSSHSQGCRGRSPSLQALPHPTLPTHLQPLHPGKQASNPSTPSPRGLRGSPQPPE